MKLGAWVAVVGVVLGVVACGGDDDGGGAVPPPTAPDAGIFGQCLSLVCEATSCLTIQNCRTGEAAETCSTRVRDALLQSARSDGAYYCTLPLGAPPYRYCVEYWVTSAAGWEDSCAPLQL